MKTEMETRILQNQIEIMWVLHCILGTILPDLVGKCGALDAMRSDLAQAAKDTRKILKSPREESK